MFVGREKELTVILRAIGRGEGVIVSGKFGIGRTSLVKHAAVISQERFHFVFADFALSANKACERLITELLPKMANKERPLKFRAARFKLANYELPDKRQHVIVLDNISRLSAQKLDFIHRLKDQKQLLFIAIVEKFLPSESLSKLRALLYPSVLIELGYLNAADCAKFFQEACQINKVNLAAAQIEHLAELTGGYPLLMAEHVQRHIEK